MISINTRIYKFRCIIRQVSKGQKCREFWFNSLNKFITILKILNILYEHSYIYIMCIYICIYMYIQINVIYK